MTYLPANVLGRWFYLYAILDLYSRKIVGWQVHASDDSDHATHLVRRTALAEGIAALKTKPVLHGDNGATLKATTVLAMLKWLGVKPPYSRPRVRDDNAFSGTLFRTAKYRPEFPTKGFEPLDGARAWAAGFVHWYNVDHHHSGIRYVSPAERHDGRDVAILAARHALYLDSRKRNSARWSGNARNWTHIEVVTLMNCDRPLADDGFVVARRVWRLLVALALTVVSWDRRQVFELVLAEALGTPHGDLAFQEIHGLVAHEVLVADTTCIAARAHHAPADYFGPFCRSL